MGIDTGARRRKAAGATNGCTLVARGGGRPLTRGRGAYVGTQDGHNVLVVVFFGRGAGRSVAFRASEHGEVRDGADKAGSRGRRWQGGWSGSGPASVRRGRERLKKNRRISSHVSLGTNSTSMLKGCGGGNSRERKLLWNYAVWGVPYVFFSL